MENVISAHNVIAKRKQQIYDNIFNLDKELSELQDQMDKLKLLKDELLVEYDLWDKFDEQNYIKVVTTTTEIQLKGRWKPKDKLNFEDCLKAVMREAGRPVSFSDILARVEVFGYKWANYHTAHNYITNCGLVENAGQRGYYQLRV